MSRARWRNVLLFAASGGLAAVVLSREDRALFWLRYATYFTALAALLAFLVRLAAWARARFRSLLEAARESGAEILLALAAMVVLFLTHSYRFTILSDETNFVALGRTLAIERRFELPDYAKFYDGQQHALSYIFDKRPPLFAFVLSLVDTLTGYRVRNVWFLNGGLLGATVLVAAAVLRRRLGRPWNLLAVVWALANPVVMLTARGATTEPLLGLLWAVMGASVLWVLEDVVTPGDKARESVGLLIATAVLLGLCRMEAGPIAALVLAGVVLASSERRRTLALFLDDPLLWCAPALALPVLIQRLRLGGYNAGETDQPFGVRYLIDNVSNWIAIFADGGRRYPFSALVTGVEVIAVLALVVLALAGRTAMSRAERGAFLVFSAATATVFLVYSAYFWGQPTNPLCGRFYALPLFFAGLAVPALLLRFERLRVPGASAGAAVAFALVFLHAFPASHGRAYAEIASSTRHEVVAEYVLSQIPAKQLMLVTALPSQFVVYDVGVMDFDTFESTREQVLRDLERKRYDEVLFVQELLGAEIHSATPTPPGIALEPLVERSNGKYSRVRISRLKR
jgi:hypothetical protein